MLESTVHMPDCTVTIIKNYCPCLIVLFIFLIVLFMSHEKCNRRWLKKKKKTENANNLDMDAQTKPTLYFGTRSYRFAFGRGYIYLV